VDQKATIFSQDPARTRGEVIIRALVAWLQGQSADTPGWTDAVTRALAELIPPAPDVATLRLPQPGRVDTRYPRQISAALSMAQAAIGVPSRIDMVHPTWRGANGVSVTVVSAPQFEVRGVAAAAPEAHTHVFLVYGQLTVEAQSAAAAAGAVTELADLNDPRATAAALARACERPPLQPSVVFASPAAAVVQVAGEMGVDDELLDDIPAVISVLPESAYALGEHHGDPLRGVVAAVHGSTDLAVAKGSIAKLTPALYEISGGRTTSRFAQFAWRLRRRTLRLAGAGL
jgi:hypothetical protein